jgi:hypothetical protein
VTVPTIDYLESKKISRFLKSLPQEYLLLLVKTSDQITQWCLHRLMHELVARAWSARFAGEDDPLNQYVESGELSQNDYDRVWQLVECYQRLWAVVQLSEPYVKKVFEQAKLPYIFGSSFELFACVVQEQVNGEFSLCLTSYREFSAKKQGKEFRDLAQRIHKGELNCIPPQVKTEPDEKLKVTLQSKIKQFFWFFLVFGIARQKMTRNRALRNALKGYDASMAHLFELETTAYRYQGSHAWVNGELRKGSSKGIYEKSP